MHQYTLFNSDNNRKYCQIVSVLICTYIHKINSSLLVQYCRMLAFKPASAGSAAMHVKHGDVQHSIYILTSCQYQYRLRLLCIQAILVLIVFEG